MPGPATSAPSGFQSLLSASTGNLFVEKDDADLTRRKRATFEFLKACKQVRNAGQAGESFSRLAAQELQIPDQKLFQTGDLFREDVSERQKIKVLSTIETVLQRMKEMGLAPEKLKPLPVFIPDLNAFVESGTLPNPQNPADLKRLRLLKELLDTERKYVADLDLLLEYQIALKASRICTAEEVQTIFSNIEELAEYQHRFLSKLEASIAASYERVGLVFTKLEPSLVSVYSPMCINLEKATKFVLEKSSQLAAISVMEPRYELPSFLIKPLLKNTNRGSYAYYGELVLGVEASKRIADDVNQKRRESENTPAMQDLQRRVGLQPFEFGSLQIYDNFLMPSLSGVEKPYAIYLFDRILLCCQMIPLSTASKSARMLGLTEKNMPEEQSVRGTAVIKGHVFMECVTAVHEVPTKPPEKPLLKVFWRQPGIRTSEPSAGNAMDAGSGDNFELRCKDAEQCRLWKDRLTGIMVEERRRRDAITRQRQLRDQPAAQHMDIEKLNLPSEVNAAEAGTADHPLGRGSQMFGFDASMGVAVGSTSSLSYRPGEPERNSATEETLGASARRGSRGSTVSAHGTIQAAMSYGDSNPSTASWSAASLPVVEGATNGQPLGPRRSALLSSTLEPATSRSLPPLARPIQMGGFSGASDERMRGGMSPTSAVPDLQIQECLKDALAILQDVNAGTSAGPTADTTEWVRRISSVLESFAVAPGQPTRDRSPSIASAAPSAREFDASSNRFSVASIRSGQPCLRVKIHYRSEVFALQLPLPKDPFDAPPFEEVRRLVVNKIGLNSNEASDAKIRFKDEEGDMVNLGSDEDVAMLIESVVTEWSDRQPEDGTKRTRNVPTITLYVSQ
ncbi:hypothetical protein DFJ74DRAFT_735589 [Hyaloraphidium curvatum]|nr:hypothetical protein DFJ74DRAFT_735589 [Hyaloraphidium curvatum]